MKVEKKWLFDRVWTQEFTRTRQEFIAEFVGAVRNQVELATALDLGCGIGYFSKSLLDMGFRVIAVDGREENANEGRLRFPQIEFLTRNVEDPTLPQMGTFDMVLCVGLLYHLENPFRAIRNLHALTEKVLLIETMCTPGRHATMDLLDEGIGEDQSLNYVAFYPSESCLVKMLCRAGFPFVYRFEKLPIDELFTATLWRRQQRTFLAASKIPLTARGLVRAEEPIRGVVGNSDPWVTGWSRMRALGNAGLFRLRVLGSRLLRRWRKSSGTPSSGNAEVN